MKECQVPNCSTGSPYHCKGYCRTHYERNLRHGSPHTLLRHGPAPLPLPVRFWRKVIKKEGCWKWLGYIRPDGYSEFAVDTSRNTPAHRIAYQEVIGPIPAGLQLDHLCRNRACVNPHHLEPVTAQTNTLRGETPAARNVAKTHCPQGHPYDLLNTNHRGGRRHCRACAPRWWKKKV